jgi:hypothetical protein
MSTGNPPSPRNAPNWRFAGRVLVKALLLFLLVNLLFAACNPLPALGKLSAYNHLFPGRVRLPYGEIPEKAYNLSLLDLNAMFASHELAAGEKPADEYRVILIGDSSTWGFLLQPDETLAAALNKAGLLLPDGRRVHFYNLGYPVMSLMKDLLVLSRARQFKPDLIVWPFTLESFPYDKQLYPPLLQHNPDPVRQLIDQFQLKLDTQDPNFITPSPWDRTLIGSLRALADWWRLQLYGVMWAATGIDQEIPHEYTPRIEDLSAEQDFHNLQPPHLSAEDLALGILQAGIRLAGDTPILLVNEPMFISQGQKSDMRYNFYYPRWSYDDYRRILQEQSQEQGWNYADLWDAIPPGEFTNTAVHLSPEGNRLLAGKILPLIKEIIQSGRLNTRPVE